MKNKELDAGNELDVNAPKASEGIVDDGYVRVEADARFRELLKTIFTDEFMTEYTNFSNFEGFQYSSAVITNWNADVMVYARLLMDNFVKESTRFSSWEEMVMTAADLRFKRS